jgi:PGF-pre-PGF domain-containing protein
MVQFEDNSDRNTIAWEWDFNSDGEIDSEEKNPVYEFRDSGTYSVTLRAGNGTSWSNITKTNYITIRDGSQASFTAFPIEGENPLTVQFNDTSTGNVISWLWDFGDETSSIEQNSTHTYFSAGTYNVNLTVRNADGITSITTKITVFEKGVSGGGNSEVISDSSGDSSSGSSSFSGGSNSAAASPEPASNVYISVLTQKYVQAGNRIRFDFIQNATCIDFVVFDAKKTLGKTTTTIEQLNGRSVLAPVEPRGTVYRYINIWVGNENFASSENIENATVGFRMNKAEIPVNETENSTVFLQRYSKGGWNILTTQKTGEDEQYIYFQAKTPGFSPFAITFGGTTINEPEKVNKNILENSTSMPVTFDEANNKSIELTSKKDWQGFSSVIVPFIGLMLLLFIGLAIREKMK